MAPFTHQPSASPKLQTRQRDEPVDDASEASSEARCAGAKPAIPSHKDRLLRRIQEGTGSSCQEVPLFEPASDRWRFSRHPGAGTLLLILAQLGRIG